MGTETQGACGNRRHRETNLTLHPPPEGESLRHAPSNGEGGWVLRRPPGRRPFRKPWRIRGFGKPWQIRLRAHSPSLYSRSPTTPQKNVLGKIGDLSGWYAGGVSSWGRLGSMGSRGARTARALGRRGGARALEGAV